MSKSLKLFLMPLVVLSLVSSGCAKKDDGETAPKTELEGTWETTTCPNNKLITFVFSGNSYTKTQKIYSDACVTEIITLVNKGTFTLGDAVTTPASSKIIDFTIATVDGTPTSGGATQLNAGPQCAGVTDWAAGVTKSVLGLNCSGGGGTSVPNAGDIGYNVYSLPTATTLQLGAVPGTEDGERLGAATSAAVPTTLDSTVYTKQ